MQDLVNNIKPVLALAQATLTASTTSTLIIDSFGFSNLMFAIAMGTLSAADGSNYFTVTVEESDSSTFASGVATVASARIIGTELVIDDAAGQANTVAKFGIVMGTKRYFRLVFTETGTASAAVVAMALLGGARHKPVA